jgi:hypothetical protein
MDRLANQGQSESAGAGDLAKNMQDVSASASPSPTAGSTPSGGSGNTGKSDGGGLSDSDSGGDAVQFDEQLFKYGQVFKVDATQQMEVGFEVSDGTILEKVTWQVVVNRKIETLGSRNFKSSKRDFDQFIDGKFCSGS